MSEAVLRADRPAVLWAWAVTVINRLAAFSSASGDPLTTDGGFSGVLDMRVRTARRMVDDAQGCVPLFVRRISASAGHIDRWMSAL